MLLRPTLLGSVLILGCVIAPPTWAQPSPPPDLPQAPPVAPAAPAQPPQPAGQLQIETLAPRSFTAKSVRIDGLVGQLDVQVGSGPQIGYVVSGEAEAIKDVAAAVDGDVLVIDQKDPKSSSWFMWFKWSGDWDTKRVKVSLTVPQGTPLDIDGIVGNATIGDTKGPLKLEIAAADAKIGAVTSAEIDAAGAGKVEIASVEGLLDLDIAGSGDVKVGSAGSVDVDIAGSGELRVGPVAGAVSVGIAGSGDVVIESVSGPVKFSSAGSGDVVINGGKATPLRIRIMGSGSFDFNGEAVDPDISVAGSGKIRIKSYTGTLNTSGVGKVHTENGSIRVE